MPPTVTALTGFEVAGTDGRFQPAEARIDGNNIVVNLDKLLQEDDNEAEWKTAFVNAS